MELENKVILVTGATRGIGRGIVDVLAREGANVIVSSIELELANKIIDILPGGKDRHLAMHLDVTMAEERAQAVKMIIERFGGLDGLVNNAGINFVKPFIETTFYEWRKVLEMDLDSVFDLCHLAIKQFLIQGHGAIVNITSTHTTATIPGSAPYAAAKGAVNMFSKGLAVEFAKKNIRVNCVAPGLVKTEIWKQIVEDFGGNEEECLKFWMKNIPIERIMDPKEIGEVVSFLLSKRASGMNGSIVYVDGGMTSQLIANE